jgi:hypothetical protein
LPFIGRLIGEKTMVKNRLGVTLITTALFGLSTLVSCNRQAEVRWYGMASAECPEVATKVGTTYCVHKVTSLTPFNGTCNKYKVGDKVCVNCPDGSCPQTTRYYTDDDVWLRACIVDTELVDSECKTIWPKDTCKRYVTLEKD